MGKKWFEWKTEECTLSLLKKIGKFGREGTGAKSWPTEPHVFPRMLRIPVIYDFESDPNFFLSEYFVLRIMATIVLKSTRVSVPSSKLGPFPTPPEASVSPPWSQRGGGGGVRGWGDPIWSTRMKAWHSGYSVPGSIHALTLTVLSNYSQRVPLMRPSSQFFTPYAAVTLIK